MTEDAVSLAHPLLAELPFRLTPTGGASLYLWTLSGVSEQLKIGIARFNYHSRTYQDIWNVYPITWRGAVLPAMHRH